MTTDKKYYTIQTFGRATADYQSFYRTPDRAIRAAQDVHGTGTCTCTRVYEHDTLRLARSADISEVRRGERIIFDA